MRYSKITILILVLLLSASLQVSSQKKDLTDEFASTNVGDETDTSPFRDESDQLYISTSEYIRNMNILINYLQTARKK